MDSLTDLVYVAVGLSILVIALTVSAVMGIVAWRLWRLDHNAPLGEWQSGLTAGSVALFGTLIAGVFVITTFRIDRGFGGSEATVREAAEEAAEERTRDLAEQRVSGRLGFDREAFTDAAPIMPGSSVRAEFAPGVRRVYRLVVEEQQEQTMYRIEARAEDVGPGIFDPILYLYETGADNELSARYVDDDGGENFDARLEVTLGPGTYYIEVEELVGEPGICIVSVERL